MNFQEYGILEITPFSKTMFMFNVELVQSTLWDCGCVWSMDFGWHLYNR